MMCFHFTNGERSDEDSGGGGGDGGGGGGGGVSRLSKVPWARSLSVASSSADTSNTATTRRSGCYDSESRDLSDSVSFHEFLSQRRTNELRVFTFEELKLATKGFSRGLIVGEGGFGCVYKGVVRVCGLRTDVAVKQLNRNGFQGHKEWINEVNVLGVVKHPNLVKLVGYCAEDDERGIQRLLVYELMHNKSLEDHLLFQLPSVLSWTTRLRIVQDAARGLAYLHEEMEFQLIFRDFKASNILLDEDFNAKLSDFGLARQGPAEGTSHVETSVVGTVGYAAPEYVQTGRLTTKSDVWSFGVVLYELITGRRAVDCNLPRTEQKLLEWVKPYLSDSKKFRLIVDPRLEQQYCLKSARRLASLANKCLTKNPKSRPKMSEVVEILGSIISETSSHNGEGTSSNNVEMISSQALPDTETEETVDEAAFARTKQGGNGYLKKALELRERMNLKSKSIRRIEWRNWTPGIVRT